MFLLSLARGLAALVSAVLLATAVYLLWSWWDGAWVRDAAGELVRARETWRLATGGALLTWCLLGRSVVLLALAKSGGKPVGAGRDQGKMIKSRSGSTLYVEQYGPAGAPILVFTHGWGMDATFWNAARDELGDRFRIVRWDLPGLGRSRAADGKVSLELFAADLGDVLETLDRPAVLVGHSIGGMTIQTLLRDRSALRGRISGVVLLNTTFTNPLRTMVFSRTLLALQKPLLEPAMRLMILAHPIAWLSKWQSYLSGGTHAAMRLGFGGAVTRHQLDHAALLATKAPPAIESRGNLAMLHWDAEGALAAAQIPSLVVGGDIDIVTKVEASERLARAPKSALHVITGANHLGPMEQSGVYNAAIAKFATSLQPSDVPQSRSTAA